MITLLSLLQWTSLFYSISSASIPFELHLKKKTFTFDLEGNTSFIIEDNNNSVVFEIPKEPSFLPEDIGSDKIIPSKGKRSYGSTLVVDSCKKAATCDALISPTCLGTKLPYGYTTTLLPDVADQHKAQERLKRWQGLKYIPKCWAVIQSVLCALYMPKCENNTVSVTSQESLQDLCKLVSGPCRIVAQELSSEFNCQNGTKSSRSSCKNEGHKFNSTGQCRFPLVSTEVVASFYPGVEGCGLQCWNPLYTAEEHETLANTIFVLALACALFIVLSVMTLAINWEATSTYFTSQVILYINICFFNTCIGWLLQFTPGIDKKDIVCQNETLRVSGPRFDLCTVTFVIIYWSLISGLVWFVILTYLLHITFQEKTGKITESIRKKVPWFHIGAWAGVPLPLIIIICWIGEIDGSSLAGICFVGYHTLAHRLLFFGLPVIVSFIVADIFLVKSLLTLVRLKSSSQEVMSPEVSRKVKSVYQRTLLFTLLVNGLSLLTFHNLFYEMGGVDLWRSALRELIVCGFGVSQEQAGASGCVLRSKPRLDYLQFHYLAMFCAAVVITTYWVFYTESFLLSWAGFLKRLIRKEMKDPKFAPKHIILKRAYEKSKKTNEDVNKRFSVDVCETPQDPIGLNFGLNSKVSHGFSPSWAAALPTLVLRRNALNGEHSNSNCNSNYSSSSEHNSEISYSVCRVSVESRRNSNDSSVSVQALEVTKTVRKSRGGDRRGAGAGGGGSRKKRRDVRSSSTSTESFFRMTQVFAQSTGPEPSAPASSSREPYLGRRTAIGGMEDNMLLLTKQLISHLESSDDQPARSSDSGSDEE